MQYGNGNGDGDADGDDGTSALWRKQGIREIKVCKKCPKVNPYCDAIFDPILMKPFLDLKESETDKILFSNIFYLKQFISKKMGAEVQNP